MQVYGETVLGTEDKATVPTGLNTGRKYILKARDAEGGMLYDHRLATLLKPRKLT